MEKSDIAIPAQRVGMKERMAAIGVKLKGGFKVEHTRSRLQRSHTSLSDETCFVLLQYQDPPAPLGSDEGAPCGLVPLKGARLKRPQAPLGLCYASMVHLQCQGTPLLSTSARQHGPHHHVPSRP